MPTLRRVAVRGIGLGLSCLHLLIATTAVTSVALSLAPSASLVAMVSDSSLFYRITAAALSAALLATALRYAFYYYCWVTTRREFSAPRDANAVLLEAGELPFLKFQITTKGGALPVVERGLQELDAFCRVYPKLGERISAEVITEAEDEVGVLDHRFRQSALAVFPTMLPTGYQPPNGTGLKARALHYMVEKRRAGFNRRPGKTFIVHLDEETCITEPELLVLCDYVSRDPRPISQGPIFYPLDWRSSSWLCRALECVRPFGCSECAAVMRKPPPTHLHGSNLVVEETAENAIGWDFGTANGQPFVAEDLIFGLKAFAALGKEAFGWHGAAMLEQPPPSAYWAFRQRKRWVQGAIQGLHVMWRSDDFAQMPRLTKVRLHLRIAFRIATYALGFPIGLTGITFLIHHLTGPTPERWLGALENPLGFALATGAAAWLVSYQIGLARNLRFQHLPWYEKARQGFIILALTPLAGLVETIGPFIAVMESLFGVSKATWSPTPKRLPARPAATLPSRV